VRGALPVVVGERVVQGGVINDVLGGGWEGMGMGDGSGSIPALDPPVMDSDTWCPSLPAPRSQPRWWPMRAGSATRPCISSGGCSGSISSVQRRTAVAVEMAAGGASGQEADAA